jgi:hypothetical protein
VPGATALVYLIELVSGVEFAEWSQRWDALPSGRRTLYGVTVAVGALLFLSVAIPLTLKALGRI